MYDASKTPITREQRHKLIEDLTAQRMAATEPGSAGRRFLGCSVSSVAIAAAAGVLMGVGGLTGVGLIAIPAFCLLAGDGEEARLAKTREAVIRAYGLQEPPKESIFSRLGRLLGKFGEALAARLANDVREGVWGKKPVGDLTYQWHTHANRVTFSPVVGLRPVLPVNGPSLKITLGQDGSLTAARYEGAKLQAAPGGYASMLRTDAAGTPMSLAWHNEGRVTETWTASRAVPKPRQSAAPEPAVEAGQPTLPGFGR
jgi:hypothetical protein